MKINLVVLIMSLAMFGCNSPSGNQNSVQKNANVTSHVASIPYSAPPAKRGSKDLPTAVEVAQVLKKANIFPKENAVRENQLSDADKSEGAISSVNIASFHPEGYTVKVYQSIDQRNKARLRMINQCPGCNFIVECDSILMYERISKDREMNVIGQKHARERYDVLRRYFGCG